GRERHARLVPVFRRQSLELTRPHVRRIRHDDIVGGAPERAEVIGLLEQYTAPETVGADVGARHLERRLRDIDRIDAGVRQRARACAQGWTRRRRRSAPPPARAPIACSTSAAASSRALSVPCPKCTRARASARAARAMSSPTVTGPAAEGACGARRARAGPARR